MNPSLILSIFVSLGLLSFGCTKQIQEELPRQYDLRKEGQVPGVREQAWGTCWAFATTLALETNLMKTGRWDSTQNKTPYLSPYYIDKYSGFTRKGHNQHVNESWYSGQGNKYPGTNKDDLSSGLVVHLGGDFYTSSAFLTNTKGAVSAYKTPKIPRAGDHQLFGDLPTEGVLWENNYDYFFPKKIIWLTKSGNDLEKRKRIKKAIIEHGAVATIQYKVDTPIGVSPDGLPIHGVFNTNNKPDHAINLIGWNDSLLHKGNYGAWLAQDSDHRTKNDKPQGFFYVLYDDVYAAKDKNLGAVSFQEVVKNPFKEVYSHSLHGLRYITHPKDNVKAVANRFVATRDHKLKGIGLYVSSEESKFEVELKIDLKGEPLLTKSGALDGFGFHYIDLSDEEIKWKEKQELYLVLKLANGMYAYDASSTISLLLGKNNLPKLGDPIAVNSMAKSNQSFWKNDQGNWTDFSTFIGQHNGHKDHPHASNHPTANLALNLYVD